MQRMNILISVVVAGTAATVVTAPAALAARPSLGPMTVSCTVSGIYSTGTAVNPPKGTRAVNFSFYRDYAASIDPYGITNGETDTNGRDGWSGFGEANPPDGWSYAPTWVVITAQDRKGNILVTEGTACPS